MGTRNEVRSHNHTLCCGSALENHGGTADGCHRSLRFGGAADGAAARPTTAAARQAAAAQSSAALPRSPSQYARVHHVQ